MKQPACPFCAAAEPVLANDLAVARRDLNPVTPGHLLLITRRHVADFFEITADERIALLDLLQQAKNLLAQEHRPDGFNVGEAAGQTVAHVHVHLIPRYRGDTPRPRGGVRGVIPDKQSY